MIDKINNDPIYGQTFGKFIILAIDRLEYVDKAVYLGRTCKFYEREHISKALFIRLKGIIEKVELADLQKLHCSEENDYYGYPSNFDSAGLFLFQSLDLVVFEHTINDFKQFQTFELSGKSSDMPKPSRPKLTDLGKVLIHVVNDILLDPSLKSVAMKYR